MVKKCALLKIVHEKYHVSTSSKKMTEAEVAEFQHEMHIVAAENKEVAPFVGKAQEILNPLRVLHLFEHIQEEVRTYFTYILCICIYGNTYMYMCMYLYYIVYMRIQYNAVVCVYRYSSAVLGFGATVRERPSREAHSDFSSCPTTLHKTFSCLRYTSWKVRNTPTMVTRAFECTCM